jgi:hypothetical protein
MTEGPRTLVSVGGVSFSGSTMLALILGNHPCSFTCGEAVNLFRPMHTHHFTPKCACGQEPCPVWSRLRDTTEQTFYGDVFSALDVRVLIDSSKELSWLVDARAWARRSLPGVEVVNVFTYKDPLDLSYSFWKRGRDPMFWRSQFVVYYQRLFAIRLPLLTVKLGRLLASPATTVRQMCDVLGLPYVSGMERFWEGEQHHLFGNLGVRRQTQAGQSAFETTPPRDDRFAQHEDDVRRAIAGDAEVRDIMRRLDAAEIGNRQDPVPHQDVEIRPPYPLWYYGQRLRRAYRRYRPRTLDRRVTESASTAPRGRPGVDDRN